MKYTETAKNGNDGGELCSVKGDGGSSIIEGWGGIFKELS